MSSWTTCPCCGRMIGVRKDGAFRVHGRSEFKCPGSRRTITQLLQCSTDRQGAETQPEDPQ